MKTNRLKLLTEIYNRHLLYHTIHIQTHTHCVGTTEFLYFK